MEPSRKVRAFVALKPPENWTEQMAVLQAELKRALKSNAFKWVMPDNIHITLRFLGDLPEGDVPRISRALARVGREVAPFAVESARLGCFPSVRRARVLWLGIRGAASALAALHARVVETTKDFGEPPEDRPFRAHLTLARTREMPGQAAPRLENVLNGLKPPHLGWEVADVLLMRSHLSPAGPRYEVMHSMRLDGVE